MRGKLRDKRIVYKHDSFHREDSESRRPYKRDARNALWTNQQMEEEDYEYSEEFDNWQEDDELDESEVKASGRK